MAPLLPWVSSGELTSCWCLASPQPPANASIETHFLLIQTPQGLRLSPSAVLAIPRSAEMPCGTAFPHVGCCVSPLVKNK